jgi:hypothetical protein
MMEEDGLGFRQSRWAANSYKNGRKMILKHHGKEAKPTEAICAGTFLDVGSTPRHRIK